MSCHNIGRGLNVISRKTIELLDEGKITKDVARELFRAIHKGVGCCDGNDYEAVAYIEKSWCGCCLRKMEVGEPMYSLYEVSYPRSDLAQLWEIVDENFATSILCTECFDKTINEYMHSDTAGEEQRKYIESQYSREELAAIEPPSGKYWNY